MTKVQEKNLEGLIDDLENVVGEIFSSRDFFEIIFQEFEKENRQPQEEVSAERKMWSDKMQVFLNVYFSKMFNETEKLQNLVNEFYEKVLKGKSEVKAK